MYMLLRSRWARMAGAWMALVLPLVPREQLHGALSVAFWAKLSHKSEGKKVLESEGVDVYPQQQQVKDVVDEKKFVLPK